MSTSVGTKGQFVIERAIRSRLGIKPGFIAVQQVAGDHLEVRFYPPEHSRSLRGILADSIAESPQTDDWNAVREQAWEAAVRTDKAGNSDE